jgi:2-methylcitrate dehydratase
MGGKPLRLPQPYAEYVVQNSMFKFVTAGMHSQSAVECAFRLHPLVKDRIAEIARVEMHSSRDLIDVIDKTGPLHSADDRDHCAQYVVAVGMIFGKLGPRQLEDDFAADPRIDELRGKTMLSEDPRYTKDYYDPSKRSSANSIQVWFKDGSSTPKTEVEYPLGHQRRRAEAMAALRSKFAQALERRFPAPQRSRILATCDDGARFDSTPVHEFVELFVAAA